MLRFNYRLVARVAGMLLLVMSFAMALPLAVSVVGGDGSQYGLALSAVVMLCLGLALRNIVGRHARFELHERESYWITALVWMVVPLVGALPYLFTGATESFTDAAFESFSGFTTTGSTILADPAEIPEGLLLWRSLTQWIGGLGLILFVVAMLPRLRGDLKELYAAEFSGTQQRQLHPHISTSVNRMWQIYTIITALLAVALVLVGNGPLDSVCLALSTVSTGGFMTSASGLAGYGNLSVAIITAFMFLSGLNVALLYNFFTFRWRRLRRNDELAVYAALFVVATAACVAAFFAGGEPLKRSISYSLFHVASTISSCGFYTSQPTHWPLMVSALTFLLIVVGAMAGSTGGGIKLRRVMTLSLYLRNYFTRMIHPDAVFSIRIDGRVVEPEYVNRIFGFIFLYICFIIGGAFCLTLCGYGIADSFCLAAANISNLGPSPIVGNFGLGFSYQALPVAAKWTLTVLMLAGRLEFYALLAVVSPIFWRRR